MAVHVWTVLCSKVSIDQRDNRLSIFDVIEELTVSATNEETEAALDTKELIWIQSNMGPAMSLVSLWWRDDISTPESDSYRLKILDPKDKLVAEQEIPIDLESAVRTRTILDFPGVPFRGTGIYKYLVQRKPASRWRTEATLLISMKIQ